VERRALRCHNSIDSLRVMQAGEPAIGISLWVDRDRDSCARSCTAIVCRDPGLESYNPDLWASPK